MKLPIEPKDQPLIEGCIHLCEDTIPAIAEFVFTKVFRTDFTQPGFAILVLPASVDSKQLRESMVKLKQALSKHYEARWGESLEYLSLGRFDQQTSTKLHLDGAPEHSFLMLGYEPTTVRSELHIADYSRYAHELGLTPTAFLEQRNPMFVAGRERLEPHTLTIKDWHEDRPRIVLINNSSTSPGHPQHTPGVMHGALIPQADSQATRIINSTMIAPASLTNCDCTLQEEVFLATEAISNSITT